MDLAGDEALELKQLFLRELDERHAIAQRALAQDPPALHELRDVFHRIAGTAEAVELGMLGRLASVCEATLDALIDGSIQPTRRTARILREGVAGIAAVLASESKLDVGAMPEIATRPAQETSRILVVDDDPVSARLIETVLRSAGFSSILCGDPRKAFNLALQESPDLIILDVAMPRMDGFRLCQRLRAHPGLQITPVIFVTRKGDVEQRVRGLSVGGNDYVAKPFEPQELVARVRSHLQRLAELRELALRDGLTRCYNNEYFKRRLDQELSRAARHQKPLTVAMLDIDHFKRINDSYGHPAGDVVLARLASILNASVRSHDVVARYGGEEFGIILVETGAEEATVVANRLRERVQAHRFEAPGQLGEPLVLSCTVSIGLADFRKSDTPVTLLQRADAALYHAKNAGRNRVSVADEPGDLAVRA
jgi:diguanylate cyclase (GGDEF)-like protein